MAGLVRVAIGCDRGHGYADSDNRARLLEAHEGTERRRTTRMGDMSLGQVAIRMVREAAARNS